MKTLLRTASILLIAFIFFSFQSLVPPKSTENTPVRGWVKLGKRTVSKGSDHDVLMVTRNKGKFRKLLFKVTRSPVHIRNIKVIFADGSSQNVVINRNLKKGSTTRIIDLQGRRRIIKKIVFNYHTRFVARGKARIHVFGMH